MARSYIIAPTPKCSGPGCFFQWENKAQTPWVLAIERGITVVQGEEPYLYFHTWRCVESYAGNRAKEEA